jgi:hypothetical protein
MLVRGDIASAAYRTTCFGDDDVAAAVESRDGRDDQRPEAPRGGHLAEQSEDLCGHEPGGESARTGIKSARTRFRSSGRGVRGQRLISAAEAPITRRMAAEEQRADLHIISVHRAPQQRDALSPAGALQLLGPVRVSRLVHQHHNASWRRRDASHLCRGRVPQPAYGDAANAGSAQILRRR